MDKKTLSIICPVFNEEAAIPLFHERLRAQIARWSERYHTEIIFTNNCSSDRTLEIIRGLRAADPAVNYITFTRNFGYQASIACGLAHARGDAAVIIDVDCEDPPEMIHAFIEKWEQGYDIVYGRRDDRPEGAALKAARKFFYRFTRLIADNDFIIDMAEFALLTRRVIDEVTKIRSSFPFIRNELGYIGFRRVGIPYSRQPRIAGTTNYNIPRMTVFAIAGILTSSTFPLRATAFLVPPLLLVNLIGLLAGWTTLVFGLDFACLLASNMFLSVYLARVYKNGISRPLFIVDAENTQINPTEMNR